MRHFLPGSVLPHAYYLRFSPIAPVWKLFPDEYAISTSWPGADNIGSSGRPAFDALHWMRGKVALAKLQLCANMDRSGEAQYPSRFLLDAQLALSDWRTA
jgi:hypothetical protein